MKVLSIDQSIRGTAWSIFDESSMTSSGKFDTSDFKGFTRVSRVVDRLNNLLQEHSPNVVALEDYARQAANSSSLIPLVELGGCIKLTLINHGFREGWAAANQGNQAIFVQNQSTMKKFILGKGNVSKDSGYLLAVYKATGIEFADDDLADSYMHGRMACTVMNVLRGKTVISTLPKYQQEVLLEAARSGVKGMSKAKAAKLTDDEKLKLIRAA